MKLKLSPLLCLLTAPAISFAADGDTDRVMAFLYQNAHKTTISPEQHIQVRQNTAGPIPANPGQFGGSETQPTGQTGYESEVSRLKKLAHGNGQYRTPVKNKVYDTIEDIRNYIAVNREKVGNCWGLAATRYDLNPYLLYSIALVESGMKPGITSRPNSDGTHDIGLMQINSNWLKTSRFKQAGITNSDLLDACTNIHIGAWVLKEAINTKGYTWEAIGSYNAWKNKKAQHRYATKVYTMYGLVMESRKNGELFKDPLAPLRRFHVVNKMKKS